MQNLDHYITLADLIEGARSVGLGQEARIVITASELPSEPQASLTAGAELKPQALGGGYSAVDGKPVLILYIPPAQAARLALESERPVGRPEPAS